MTKTLTPCEEKLRRELLNMVVAIAGTNENNIRQAIITALRQKGELGQGQRTNMLWAELERKAVPRVRKAQKYAKARQPSLI